MADWSAPTLADAGVTGTVRCQCGRRESARVTIDLNRIPEGTRTLRDIPAWACPGCIASMFAGGTMTREEFVTWLGAPPEQILKASLRDAEAGASFNAGS